MSPCCTQLLATNKGTPSGGAGGAGVQGGAGRARAAAQRRGGARVPGRLHAAAGRRARRRLLQAQDDDAQGAPLPLLVQHLLRDRLRRRHARAGAARQ